MTNQQIFCNTPWYELHIYWDGGLGICCQEAHRLSSDKKYNIANMTIAEWFNSPPVNEFRSGVLGSSHVSACQSCYNDEAHGGRSRRIRSNQKSVIFTRQAFDDSFKQSPGYKKFMFSNDNHGQTTTMPVELHIDLGNHCNLACKMCNPQASSTIAAQEVKWKNKQAKQYLGNSWALDESTWSSFKQQLLSLPDLNNIHLMGGETLLTDRFEDLVDFMIEHQRFDVCWSFVTNGTVFKPRLLDKLKKFRRVGIEVSIETVDDHNAYQRQGTDTKQVLDNIDQYLKECNGTTVTVSLRPAPSILSVGYYPGLLQYALDKQLVVKSNLCYEPDFLHINILPADVKQLYQERYTKFLEQLDNLAVGLDYNASDPNNYQQTIKEQATTCLSLLNTPTLPNSDQLLEKMVRHCERWDQVYGYDARTLYPEFTKILEKYDYKSQS